MDYLVDFTVTVPAGTPASELEQRTAGEGIRVAALAAQGHVLRVWKPLPEDGRARALGLYRAADDSELEAILESLPLRPWMEISVTALAAHPNDPAATSERVNRSVMPSTTTSAQIRFERVTPAHCRVILDNPPVNLMGPEFVLQVRELITALENDDDVKVVVFESAVDGFFLNHSDFLANFEDLTSIPQGPTGLEAWPDVLVRLTRAPFVSIALIRGRATGNGSELALACDMSFVSRENAVLSQWEVGVGLVAGGGPMARLPRLMGRGRALEVLLSSDDIGGADAERLGYVNRALPDAELDDFVNALATRIASFDKWAIANTKRLVNDASLPPDVEIRAGWDACMASVKRPAAQERIKALLEQGLQKPGDSEDQLGFIVGQLGLNGER